MYSRVKDDLIPTLAYPITISAALAMTWVGFEYFDLPHTGAAILAISIFGFVAVPILERFSPYRERWNKNDEDLGPDILHLVISNLLIINIEKILLIALLLGFSSWLIDAAGGSLWPTQWPLLAQLLLMLVIAEFGRYWIHYAAHKLPFLWRFHAVHHSPNRLYFLNAARFHPLEKIWFQLPEVVPFILLGTNLETLTLYLTFNTMHGLF